MCSHVGPAEAHRPSVPSNLCICRETEWWAALRWLEPPVTIRLSLDVKVGREAVARRSDPFAMAPAQAGDLRNRYQGRGLLVRPQRAIRLSMRSSGTELWPCRVPWGCTAPVSHAIQLALMGSEAQQYPCGRSALSNTLRGCPS